MLLAAALLAGSCLFTPLAGQAQAAEYEVRMPVAKTARIAPEGETPGGLQKPDASKAAPVQKAPKTAMGRAVEAAAVSAAPPASTSAQTAAPAVSKPAQAKAKAPSASGSSPETQPQKLQPEPSKAGAEHPASSGKGASPVVVSAGAPIPVPGAAPAVPATAPASVKKAPKPEPMPRPLPKPKPEPVVDPKALEMPAPQAASEKIPLPAQGQWVGDVELEFHESSVVLRAATNGAVERVTWFNQTEPRKLAADLRGGWKKKGAHVLRFDAGPIKNVIVGEHDDRLRLAIQFRDGAVQPGLDPKVETGPKGVTLTIPLAVRLTR